MEEIICSNCNSKKIPFFEDYFCPKCQSQEIQKKTEENQDFSFPVFKQILNEQEYIETIVEWIHEHKKIDKEQILREIYSKIVTNSKEYSFLRSAYSVLCENKIPLFNRKWKFMKSKYDNKNCDRCKLPIMKGQKIYWDKKSTGIAIHHDCNESEEVKNIKHDENRILELVIRGGSQEEIDYQITGLFKSRFFAFFNGTSFAHKIYKIFDTDEKINQIIGKLEAKLENYFENEHIDEDEKINEIFLKIFLEILKENLDVITYYEVRDSFTSKIRKNELEKISNYLISIVKNDNMIILNDDYENNGKKLKKLISPYENRLIILDPFFNNRYGIKFLFENFSFESKIKKIEILFGHQLITSNQNWDFSNHFKRIKQDYDIYLQKFSDKNIKLNVKCFCSDKTQFHKRNIILDDDMWQMPDGFDRFHNNSKTTYILKLNNKNKKGKLIYDQELDILENINAFDLFSEYSKIEDFLKNNHPKSHHK